MKLINNIKMMTLIAYFALGMSGCGSSDQSQLGSPKPKKNGITT